MSDNQSDDKDCVIPGAPVPADELGRYSFERDPHREKEIADYVEGQARGESVQHVERIKEEVVLGERYEIWDVTTDKERWWVITNLTNLYTQRHFQSLDYTLSFHIGLMMRMRSRPEGPESADPTPFDDVFRRQEQAKEQLDRAKESEDYQAVGMQLRECLLSLIAALRRRITLGSEVVIPQGANFIAWMTLLMDHLCQGSSNKELRQFLKNAAKDSWQLVNWLTHDRSANKTAASIAIHATDAIVGHCVQILVRERTDSTDQCPRCSSRQIRSHFDIDIAPDGDYYMTCAACGWTSHPTEQRSERPDEA